MRVSKTRLIAMVFAVGLIATIFVVRRESKREIVKPTVSPTLDSLINVHGSPKRGLRVCGKHFTDLMGLPPFWMPVQDTGLILFAYRPGPGERLLVLCDTNACTFHEIPLYNTRFGNNIGRKILSGEDWGDRIESIDSNNVVLVSIGFKYREKSALDLREKSIRVLELHDERVPPLELP